MSFLHNSSCASLKTELDLFALPGTQTAIESGQWVHYKPLSSVNDSTVCEFHIDGTGDEYIDPPHTLIHAEVVVLGKDKKPLTDAFKGGPVNYFLHSLFSQVDVSLNGKLITQSSYTYAHRAYIEALLGYDKGCKNSHLSTRIWEKDTAGAMEGLIDTNLGLAQRSTYIMKSRKLDLIGPIHSDFFNQDRFLLNGVDMRVRLTRSKDSFALMSDDPDVSIKLLDLTLLVRKVKVSPGILLGHQRALEKSTAKYPITRVDIKTVTIGQGIQSKSIDNLFIGQLPKRVIIGLVDNSAFNGDFSKNPYNFQHFGLNFLSLYADGRQIPTKPLTPQYSEGLYAGAYYTLFSGTGIHFKDEGNDITRDEYAKGYTLYAFDLTPDLSSNEAHWNLQKHANMRLEIRFAKSLPSVVNCLVYAEFDNLIEIDRNRNIVVDYSS